MFPTTAAERLQQTSMLMIFWTFPVNGALPSSMFERCQGVVPNGQGGVRGILERSGKHHRLGAKIISYKVDCNTCMCIT